MREIRPSGSEGGARFYPSFLPLSAQFVLDECIIAALRRTTATVTDRRYKLPQRG